MQHAAFDSPPSRRPSVCRWAPPPQVDCPVAGKTLRGRECMMSGPFRVGVDVGGTFSDFVILDESTGGIRVLKIPSTPADPSLAVLDGVSRLAASDVSPSSITFFSHGTTVATNALLETKGAD